MKLVIQIPCLDEEATLPATVADLPRALPGIDTIEILVIDDGSRDATGEVAKRLGVHRVVRFTTRRGLARAFAVGLRTALEMGADIIVNTDADNQYRGEDIARLVAPILEGTADMVVGARPIDTMADFSPTKKLLQKIGSGVVRRLAHVDIADATSGFRAYNRFAALRMTVLSEFTYTLETLIQAPMKGIAVTHVPVRTNRKTRESRLFSGMGAYISRSLVTMFRITIMYQPLKFFWTLSAWFLGTSLILFGRFAWFAAHSTGPSGHVQSVVVAGALAVIGFLLAVFGVLADLTAMNRRLLEEAVLNSRLARLPDSRHGQTPS